MKKITVLSLCDGMSCAQIALNKLSYECDYYASEIDVAIKVTQYNFPETKQLGDVKNLHYNAGVLYSENGNFTVPYFDLVIFGSPCQSLSIANYHNRNGLEGKKRYFL